MIGLAGRGMWRAKSVALSPCDPLVACVEPGDARLWDFARGVLVAEWSFRGGTSHYPSVLFAPGGECVVTVADLAVEVWDRAGRAVCTLPVRQCSHAAFSADGVLLTSYQGRNDLGKVELSAFDPATWRRVEGYGVPKGCYVPRVFAPEPGGRRLATNFGDVFDPRDPSDVENWGERESVRRIAWCPGRPLLAVVSDWGRVTEVFDTRGAGVVTRLTDGLKYYNAVAFTPDGTALLAGGTSGIVRRTDTATWAEAGSIDLAAGAIRDLAVSADGLTAAALCNSPRRSGKVVVWDLH